MVLWLTSVLLFRDLFVVLLPKSMVHFFSSFLSRSVRAEIFRRDLAMFCIALRNEFSSFVFSDGFNCNIASTFSSFGLIPFSSSSCPSHFVWLMKNLDTLILARYLASPICSGCQTVFFRDLVNFPALQQLCHLVMPVFYIRVSGHFFLETL